MRYRGFYRAGPDDMTFGFESEVVFGSDLLRRNADRMNVFVGQTVVLSVNLPLNTDLD